MTDVEVVPATITPLPSGRAVLPRNGVDQAFPSTWAAVVEARVLGLLPVLTRFPNPSPAA